MMMKVLALAALVASASAGAANKTAAIAKLMVRERARGRGRRKMRKNALRRRAWRACAPGATGGPVPPPAARAGASPSAHPRVGPRSHHPPCPSSGRGADGGAVWTAAALKNPLDSERGAGAHGVGGWGGLTLALAGRALGTGPPGHRACAKEVGRSPRPGVRVVGSWAGQALRTGGALRKGARQKKTRPPARQQKEKMHPQLIFPLPRPPTLPQPGESDLVMAKSELTEAVRERENAGAEG